jgi:HAE1 family hydrophobic/amphiphilic exporter-1
MQKLAEVCIRRPVFTTMLVLALVVVGLDSYRKLGVDHFPKVEFPFVNVTTVLRGASPEEVESQVTKPLEEVLNTISGIDELNSYSAEGMSIITIGFVLEKDPEIAAQEVRDKISTALGQLPRDADPPVVEKLATDAAPVLNVVVSANRDLREITKIVDDRLKKNLESLAGVGQVRFVGDRKRQIQVVLDGEKLYSYNLNIEQVRGALAAQNIEIPGGRIDQGNRELSLRTLGRVERPADFGRIVVANAGGAPVRINDIGHVVDGFEEPRSSARLDGVPAVVLAVRKQAGTNTLEVIARVKERIGELKPLLPPDFKLTYSRDQSGFINAAFHAVQEHLVLGGCLAAIIVMLFIRNWRSTLIAAVAIPASIVSTYTLMQYMGFTLNQITMLALTLVVGIVIDDAIVVLENIFRHMEEKGMTPMQAAVEGTREIGLAVMATTLSLVIIFLPIALMPGIVGRFMSSFGFTAAFAIMVSLLVSFTLTPMLCSRFLRITHKGETKEGILFRMLAGPYKRMLAWSLGHRWAIAAVAVLVMASAVPMVQTMGVDFLPVEDQSVFEVSVRMPVGSSLEGTTQVMAEIEKDLLKLPGVRDLLTTIGADMRRQVDRGTVLVELVDVAQREFSQRELMEQARQALRKYPDITVGVQNPPLIQGAVDRDFQYSIQGPDLAKLEQYANQLMERLRRVPGVEDLELTYEAGKPEMRVNINRDKAADLNVNVAQVANAMRILVGGEVVTSFKEGDDRYDVELRVREDFRNSGRALERLYVPSAALGNVPVANVASLEPGSGPAVIERWNRQRRVMVWGNLSQNLALGDLLNIVRQEINSMKIPPEYQHGAIGRSRELERTMRNFVIAFLLSVVFMYMILAANYESFIDPVTILLSLPLSAPFALLSLFLAGENYSIVYTSLGILVLFGIVKKNSILQIDHIKGLRRGGLPRREAIEQGCLDRLRPILMTTAALVAGMIPLALGTGAGAGTRRTVAIVVIGGQSLALLLTLLVTPVAYSIFDDIAHSPAWGRLGRLVGRLRPGRAAQQATGLLLILALAATVAVAQTGPAPRVGVGFAERRLTIDAAVRMALANNLEIELERANVVNTLAALKGARGMFDPLVRLGQGLETRNTPMPNPLMAPNGVLMERFATANVSLLQRTAFHGLSTFAEFDNLRQTTNNPFIGVNPFLQSRLTLGFTLPLARNREIDPARAELLVRARQADQSSIDLELKVADVVTRTQNAYWDLRAALEDAGVAEDGVNLAREQLDRTRRQIESGTLAAVELAASEAELQRRIDGHMAAAGAITMAENALKTMLTADREDRLWHERIVPASEHVAASPPEDLAEAIRLALGRRAELRSLATREQAVAVQLDLAKDQMRPQVNLVANYTNMGMAGAEMAILNPFAEAAAVQVTRINDLSRMAGLPALPIADGAMVMPPFLLGGFARNMSNLFGGAFQTFQAGVQIEWNPRNRTAQAAFEQGAVAERRLRLARRQVEMGIEAEVRNAIQAVVTARQRVEAARASERASKERLDSEVRLFQTGESTNFMVLTRQNETLDSRRRAVVAALTLNRALARLDQAVGQTLDTHAIRVE